MTTVEHAIEEPDVEELAASSRPEPEAVQGGGESLPIVAKRFGADAALALAITVMVASPGFRTLFLAELEWVLFPAIVANQYKLYIRGKKPVGFAAWARVSSDVDARLRKGNVRLKPTDWTSGDIIWVIHVLAPFGGGEIMLADIKKTALAGHSFHVHRLGADGIKIETVGGEE